ncbi:FMN-dependent L-lactate dehydrogenase LldD [Sphingomonas sp. CFBP 13706]|uniref:FMN-dependent L-lactate dehydrogenase LldD n=1 Tax=Sphingomonas sp. CFBP 13706 TaxID=2775314 RepID=UPI001780CA0A|nr:FMN-dependent L-lactate dehydrogenase LldD [Sphingomonas sp. CFBP 13706]MBD8736669.1 FMN-dependent L-lactate dehydrogenase LldD [Sphingomonas sp. CFBP 13706]
MTVISSPGDFRIAAQSRLPRFLFDYADGGAGSEATMRANVEDLARVGLCQRVMCDVADIDLSADLMGVQRPLPIALAPIGIAGMYRRRAEVQAARAATSAGIPFTLSTVGLCSLTEVRAGTAGPLWFQLYVIRDRGFMSDLIETAKEQGAEALVFTVDMPVPGSRHRDAHSGMSGPYAPLRRAMQAVGHPGWAWDVGVRGRPHRLGNLTPVLGEASGMDDYIGWLAANFDPSIAWKDIGWIRAAWKGPLIIKGILDPEDARAALDAGADAIVVSNHGGRQLDGASSTARALPAISDAVGGRLSILADSGIRSGTDVIRMLALGADGVLLGRAWLYAVAAGGEAGVAALIGLIEREMRVTMALTGVRSIGEIDRSILLDG